MTSLITNFGLWPLVILSCCFFRNKFTQKPI